VRAGPEAEAMILYGNVKGYHEIWDDERSYACVREAAFLFTGVCDKD
jgi:hypothetical protein